MTRAISLLVVMMTMFVASCASPRHVYVAPVVQRRPVPPGSSFRILTGPPPKGAVYVGTVTMNVDHSNLPEVFNELRASAQSVGANVVAFFRCGARRDYIVTQNVTVHETRHGTYAESSSDVQEITEGFCGGRLYYLDPPPAPAR